MRQHVSKQGVFYRAHIHRKKLLSLDFHSCFGIQHYFIDSFTCKDQSSVCKIRKHCIYKNLVDMKFTIWKQPKLPKSFKLISLKYCAVLLQVACLYESNHLRDRIERLSLEKNRIQTKVGSLEINKFSSSLWGMTRHSREISAYELSWIIEIHKKDTFLTQDTWYLIFYQ